MVLQRKRVANAVRVRELIDAAFAARYQDLTLMLKLSSEAVALAEEKSHELPDDLIVAAWTQYGNALRIAGRYEESERALDRAASHSTSDLPTRVHLLEVTASLHRDTKRFASAADVLTIALELHKTIGDSLAEARTYNLLGLVCFDWGQRQRAIDAYYAALGLLGHGTPRELLATTGHNLVEALIADGRFTAAASALAILQPYFRRFPPGRLTAKTEWLHARLCRELKQFTAARVAYERAYAILCTERHSHDFAELVKEMEALPAASDPRA